MALSEAGWQKIAAYVRSYLMRTTETFGHQSAAGRAANRWTHTLNVCQNLDLILDGEDAARDTRDVCRVAAMFHDIDHFTVELQYHGVRGAETAAHVLKKEGYEPEFIRRVAEIVRGHYWDLDDERPVAEQAEEIKRTLNLETRMVMDAENLDKIGVSNVLQAVATLTATRKCQPADLARELISGWPLERARLWMELLTTPTGQRLGAERFAFYEQVLKEIEREMVLDDPYPSVKATQEVARV